jgi:hypothetical protein
MSGWSKKIILLEYMAMCHHFLSVVLNNILDLGTLGCLGWYELLRLKTRYTCLYFGDTSLLDPCTTWTDTWFGQSNAPTNCCSQRYKPSTIKALSWAPYVKGFTFWCIMIRLKIKREREREIEQSNLPKGSTFTQYHFNSPTRKC